MKFIGFLLGLIGMVGMTHGMSVQEMIDQAVKTGQKRIVLPKGIVKVEKNLMLRKIDGLTIEGTGTTLVFSDSQTIAIRVSDSRNLVLRGFAVDYDPLPYVQGTITGRSADGKQFDFVVHEGYPGLKAEDQAEYKQVYVFEADRVRWLRWVPDLYPRKVEIVDARHGRLVFGRGPEFHDKIQVGHRIAITLRTGSVMRMDNCENVRVEDVTILASPSIGIMGRYMRGDNYFRYTIKPGEKPKGAKEPRLISTGADGFNYAYATKGPVVEGCRFSFMGDDSVNLHGATLVVLRNAGEREILAAWPYGPESLASVMPAGATVRVLKKEGWEVRGQGKLREFVAEKQRPSDEDLAKIQAVWPRVQGRGTIWRVTLAGPLKVEEGDFMDVVENNAPGYVIRNCVFEDHRARGLRVQAAQGLIENNTFRRLRHSAITLGAEYGFWREAGWVHDVIVRGNRIEDVCQDAGCFSPREYTPGAISIFGRREEKSTATPWTGNRNIVIENNRISGCTVAGIHVYAAKDVLIRNNRVERVMYHPGEQTGQLRGVSVQGPIDVRQAVNVKVEGNVVTEAGVGPKE